MTKIISTSKTINKTDIEKYASAAGDFNPIHLDESFAKTTQFGKCIAHGMMVAASISEALTAQFGINWISKGHLKIRFKSPVFPGEQITTTGELKKNSLNTFSVKVTKNNNQVAITGEASIPKKTRLKMNSKIKIAVDAMGGDNAPHEIVSGAVEASTTLDVEILLIGDPEKLITELKKHTYSNDKISIIPSEDVILESDKPALALRQKPKASILVATSLVKKGLANASVTMGSTGAAMASAAVILGVIENVERPSLGGPILGLAPKTTIIDVGTNIDCKPSQILSFAIIGHVYAKVFWNLSKPRIALLSVGAEENKGNKLIQESKNLLNDSPLNFIGNIEANDLTNNIADVVVCDGFVGNIVMKLTEGLGKSIAEYLSENLKGKLPDEELNHLKNQIYELNNVVEVNGGGPILGVKGVSVVGHGRGNSKSVFNAIKSAKQTVETNYIEKLNQELSQIHNTLKNE